MTEEAIILAGGLGTRLRSVVNDLPKAMAEVKGRPFLHYVMHFLATQQIKRVVIAVGYKREVIQDYLHDAFSRYGINVRFSIEEELLGTGGAIFKAFKQIEGQSAFILNGDTYFDVSLMALENFALDKGADLAFALKEVDDCSRYGTVDLLPNQGIESFNEKKPGQTGKGLINGGIYYMNKSLTSRFLKPEKFSIEQDFFHHHLEELQAYGKLFDGLFIDIGIPGDYKLSQQLLKDVCQEL
jgi:D-glycero-alpha-D-manno-heptose 1-phosphate guanylyltransferase